MREYGGDGDKMVETRMVHVGTDGDGDRTCGVGRGMISIPVQVSIIHGLYY